jgi:alcohol dehydrogenase class IV
MTDDTLRKFVVPEVVQGLGARHLLARYVAHSGARRVLVVSDAGVLAQAWAEELIGELRRANIAFAVFSEVLPNPRDHQVMAGAARYREEHCSGLVAIGGGSPMDCAKGIGMVVSCGGLVRDFEGVDRVPRPCPPMMFVPTTSGSAADVSQFAIITDVERRKKMAIVSKATIPDVSLTDPEVTVTMPPDLTKFTGLDALTHAIESLVSNASSQVTRLHSLESIRLVFEHLPNAAAEPSNLGARSGMSTASLLAGFAFSNASLGLVHAMAHALGGRFDLPHGLCNALLLPYVLEYNADAAGEALTRAAQVLGIPTASAFVSRVRSLVEALIGTVGLRSLGIREEDLQALSAVAMVDPCVVTNPRVPNADEVKALYARAL